MKRFIAGIIWILLPNLYGFSQYCPKDTLMQFEDATVYNYQYSTTAGDTMLAIVFRANMHVDADGSPRAYGPNNSGLDWTANAGRPGNWWAVITDNGKTNGIPVLQGATDPYPGMYVSATSLYDSGYKVRNPKRYVNAEVVPYISLPRPVREKAKISIGDFVWVYNTETMKSSFAVYADAGGNTGIGEGSMALAGAVGLTTDPKKGGGTSKNVIVYVVIRKTSFGQGIVPSSIQIHQRGLELLNQAEQAKIINCKF